MLFPNIVCLLRMPTAYAEGLASEASDQGHSW